MSTKPVQTKANVPEVLESMVKALVRQGSGTSAIKQGIENSLDAGATSINVVIDKKKGVFQIHDNGHGFEDQDIQSFYSIMSSSKDGKTTIGKNGSGRIAFLGLCESLVVHTKTKGDSTPKTFQLTRDHLIASFQEVQQDILFENSSEDLGEQGSVLVLGGKINWKRTPNAKQLANRLPRLLLPQVLKMVHINGEPIPSQSSIDELIEGEEDLGSLGKCRYQLDIIRGSKQGVWLCGRQNKIMPLEEAINNLPQQLREIIPDVLFQPSLTGVISIEHLNQYRGHDDTLELKFYDDHARTLAKLLTGELKDKIESAIPDETTENEEFSEKFIDQLMEKLPVRGPLNQRTRRINTPNQISKSSFMLEPGQRLSIKSRKKLDWAWESEEGGVFSPNSGKNITFIAGSEEGTFELIGSKNQEVKKRVSLKISSSIQMAIKPFRSSLAPTGTKQLSITHFSGDNDDLNLEVIDMPGNCTAELIGKKILVKASSATQGDTISLVVTDSSGKEAKAEVTIERSYENEVNFIQIEDTRYRLKPAHQLQATMVSITEDIGETWSLSIKFETALPERIDRSTLLWTQIYLAHVSAMNDHYDKKLSYPEMIMRVEELLNDLQ